MPETKNRDVIQLSIATIIGQPVSLQAVVESSPEAASGSTTQDVWQQALEAFGTQAGGS